MSAQAAKSSPLSIVVLAAGQGKRMNSALPKVLHPLAGKPLLAHVLNEAATLNPAAVHVVYGHGGDAVREALLDARVQWSLQGEQLGTGHAVQQAMPQIPNDSLVLVLYGDVPMIRAATLSRLLALVSAKSMALLTVRLEDPTGYGRIVRDRRGAVRKIVEEKDASTAQRKINEGNSGVMAVPAKLLRRWLAKLKSDNAQGEYYLTDIIAMAVRDKISVKPLIADSVAEVLGVNDKAQLAMLEAEYRHQRAQELLRAGVTLIDPKRIDVRGTLTVGRDVEIDVNVVFEGTVHLADGVRIGPNCVLRDVSVGAGTVIKPNCVFERAEIGRNCELGPFTRIRPETVLADAVHLGNFVEVKKSRVGRGSKVNHLSYIGDTSIGETTNVGAGTITCNYDGANKYRTEIGNNAFIGSGTMLVAPVKIGDGATIGAGSTISKDAPPGQLTLERSKQISIDGWKRPSKKS
jgi:bifunctional UDP-N-acetylglucosamine pyrophosphorylase / glucosamine-1-phosphate N-acetyltransferase